MEKGTFTTWIGIHITGYRFDYKTFSLIVHKPFNRWVTCEHKSGLIINKSHADTRKESMALAKEFLYGKTVTGINEQISRFLEKHRTKDILN